MTKIRSPRSATHAYQFGSYNAERFFSRRGRQVYEFSESRGQWFLSLCKPHHLAKCHRLNVFEMHPTTALQHVIGH